MSEIESFVNEALKARGSRYAIVTADHPHLWQIRKTVKAHVQGRIRNSSGRGSNVFCLDNGTDIQVFTRNSWASWGSQHASYNRVLNLAEE